MDRWTNGQTDTRPQRRPCLRIASRGKNWHDGWGVCGAASTFCPSCSILTIFCFVSDCSIPVWRNMKMMKYRCLLFLLRKTGVCYCWTNCNRFRIFIVLFILLNCSLILFLFDILSYWPFFVCFLLSFCCSTKNAICGLYSILTCSGWATSRFIVQN